MVSSFTWWLQYISWSIIWWPFLIVGITVREFSFAAIEEREDIMSKVFYSSPKAIWSIQIHCTPSWWPNHQIFILIIATLLSWTFIFPKKKQLSNLCMYISMFNCVYKSNSNYALHLLLPFSLSEYDSQLLLLLTLHSY